MFRDGAERVLVFRVGREQFAVGLSAVDEVIDAPQVGPLPDAHANVHGVTALRGELITIYDARAVLGVAGEEQHAAVLFTQAGRRVGLIVDDVQDTLMVEADEVRPAPGVDAADGVLAGVVRRGTELVALLDAGALLDALTSVAEGERS